MPVDWKISRPTGCAWPVGNSLHKRSMAAKPMPCNTAMSTSTVLTTWLGAQEPSTIMPISIRPPPCSEQTGIATAFQAGKEAASVNFQYIARWTLRTINSTDAYCVGKMERVQTTHVQVELMPVYNAVVAIMSTSTFQGTQVLSITLLCRKRQSFCCVSTGRAMVTLTGTATTAVSIHNIARWNPTATHATVAYFVECTPWKMRMLYVSRARASR